MRHLSILLAACSLLGLAACSTGAGVPLATAKAESQAITTAVNTLAPALIKTLPASAQSNATLAVAAVVATNTTIQSLSTSSSAITVMQDLVNEVSAVTAVLPLPANTELAINAGVVLIDAFIGALPAAATPAVGASLAEPGIVPGPIPIPLN